VPKTRQPNRGAAIVRDAACRVRSFPPAYGQPPGTTWNPAEVARRPDVTLQVLTTRRRYLPCASGSGCAVHTPSRARMGCAGPSRRWCDWMRYRRLITVGAVVAACGAFGAAPVLASQPSAAHPAVVAAVHPGHAVPAPHIAGGPGCNVQNCLLMDAAGQSVNETENGSTAPVLFITPVLGKVVDRAGDCWPFSDCGFDAEYSGHEVLQFIEQNVLGDCMQTDSVHSGVFAAPCGSHNAGTYWVTVGNGGTRGFCNPNPVFWLVNVGFTNHYDPYPYGGAMFNNGNGLYVHTQLPISDDDQWCTFPSG
jgi:hypothetical protein